MARERRFQSPAAAEISNLQRSAVPLALPLQRNADLPAV